MSQRTVKTGVASGGTLHILEADIAPDLTMNTPRPISIARVVHLSGDLAHGGGVQEQVSTTTVAGFDGKSAQKSDDIEPSEHGLRVSSDTETFFDTCFLAGAMLRTPAGNRAVEEMAIGDRICTYDWRNNAELTQSVKWVGHKKMVVRPHLRIDEAGYPVRILKDAISDGVPYKDLLVTPEHCLFFDGKFIPVRMLVNGRSIFYDRVFTSYTYYHIETETHSVIWANDMLTESYLDTGNRATFAQHGVVVLFGDRHTHAPKKNEHADLKVASFQKGRVTV